LDLAAARFVLFQVQSATRLPMHRVTGDFAALV
jgi:hypothetical protein